MTDTQVGWDRQGRAATWILAAPLIGRAVEQWIDFEHHRIDFAGMLDSRPWSTSEHLMIRAANDLYNGDRTAALDELVTTLDDGNLQIVLDAIKIRRGWSLSDHPVQRSEGDLYRDRAGRLIEDRDGWGWCVACGRTPVNCAEGYDTCWECCPR